MSINAANKVHFPLLLIELHLQEYCPPCDYWCVFSELSHVCLPLLMPPALVSSFFILDLDSSSLKILANNDLLQKKVF